MVDFEEKFGDKEVVKIDTNCDGNSKVRNRFPGVSKSGKKWRARIHHPKLKFEVALGVYSTPEEAALVVMKKKAEYEEMFKGENSMNRETWRGRVNRKSGSKDNDKVLEEPERDVASSSKLWDEMTGEVKVPRGVRKLESGKWVARITDPVARSRIWLGTFGTVKEAVRSFHKGKAELAAKRKRAELDGFEGPMKLTTTALDADNLNRLFVNKSNYEAREVDICDKQEHKSAHSLSLSVIEAENPNSADDEYKEMFKGENSMNVETCRDDFLVRKLPSGVRRRGYTRWGTRVYHPVLNRLVSLGSYSTPEEAAVVVKNTKAQFLKMYGWRGRLNHKSGCKDNHKSGCKDNGKVEEPGREVVSTSELWDELTGDGKVPPGMRKLKSGKWVARIEEAVRSFNKGKAELAAKIKRAELDRFEGPMKQNSALTADNFISLSADKSDHETREVDVSDKQELYCVHSLPISVIEAENPDSADVKYKMFENGNSMNMKTCRVDFEGRKLPTGVCRRGYTRWGTRIYHPMLKRKVSLGSYGTPEEAAAVLNNKRAEFSEKYGWKRTVNLKRGCNDKDKVLEESKRKVVSMSDLSEKLTSDLKVPPGVKRTKSGKWCARIRDPVAKSQIWLGTFDTVEEAIRSINKGKAELAAKGKRDELGGFESPIEPTSILGADNFNSSSVDKLNYVVPKVNISEKQEHKFILSSPTSAMDPENSNSADVDDRSVICQANEHVGTFVSDFDEAIRLGIINEYGELLGEYSELDKQMKFSMPDEDVA